MTASAAMSSCRRAAAGRRLSPGCTGSPSAPHCASCAPLSPLVYDTIGPNSPITRTALEGRVIGGTLCVRASVRAVGWVAPSDCDTVTSAACGRWL